jgi:hypothetical protein
MTHDMREADTILRELVEVKRTDAHDGRLLRAWAAAFAWADAQKAPQPEPLAHRLISSGPNAGRVKPEYVQKAAPTAAHPAGLTGADSDYRRMFGAAVASLAEISEALGIDEEKAACANGNELILEAISILAAKAQKAPQPRTAEPALSMKRHEWDSLSPEAKRLIHDRTREHTLESARAAQAIRDVPLAEPAPHALEQAARAASPVQQPVAHRFGDLLCRLLECEELGPFTDCMPANLLREWQEATDEHIGYAAAQPPQPPQGAQQE